MPEQVSGRGEGFAFEYGFQVPRRTQVGVLGVCVSTEAGALERGSSFLPLLLCFQLLYKSFSPSWFSGHPQTPSLRSASEGSPHGLPLLSMRSASGFGPQHDYFVTTSAILPRQAWPSPSVCSGRTHLACSRPVLLQVGGRLHVVTPWLPLCCNAVES